MSEKHEHGFLVIDKGAVTWDGTPTTLNPNDNVNLPQTSDGSLCLAYQNMAKLNNNGTLSVTSGGGAPTFLTAQGLANAPSILVKNWGGNNLSLTNISLTSSKKPIWVSVVGPGLSTTPPANLPTNGTQVSLVSGKAAQGVAIPRWMQLIMQATSGDYTLLVVIGGTPDASGNNCYVFGLNAAANTGPGTGTPAPAGFYATTSGNTATFQFNWGSSAIFVANESPSTSAAGSISIRAL